MVGIIISISISISVYLFICYFFTIKVPTLATFPGPHIGPYVQECKVLEYLLNLACLFCIILKQHLTLNLHFRFTIIRHYDTTTTMLQNGYLLEYDLV